MLRDSRARKVLGAAAIFAFVAAAWTGVVWAQGQAGRMGPGGRAMGPFGMGRMVMMGRIIRQLGLTAQQRQDIRAIVQSHQDQIKPLAGQAVKLHQQLQAAIAANDAATIDSLAGALGQLQADGAKLRAQIRSEVFTKLTPDQQAKARLLEQKFNDRAGAWLQKHQSGVF